MKRSWPNLQTRNLPEGTKENHSELRIVGVQAEIVVGHLSRLQVRSLSAWFNLLLYFILKERNVVWKVSENLHVVQIVSSVTFEPWNPNSSEKHSEIQTGDSYVLTQVHRLLPQSQQLCSTDEGTTYSDSTKYFQ
jgi:hypothetical protein